MNDITIKTFEKKLEFKSGECIKVIVQLTNIKDSKQTKDFLETMFKEIKNIILN